MIKPTLLYIGHSYHVKTRSTVFLLDILRPYYQITLLNLESGTEEESLASLKGLRFDIVICFQLLPPRATLNRYIQFTRGAWFPMYDALPADNDPIWHDFIDFQVINFSRAGHEVTKKKGLSSRYIQYFPEPRLSNLGDTHRAFFWQRRNEIDIYTILKLVKGSNINHITLHNAVDPKCTFIPPPTDKDSQIKITTWYSSKEELLQEMEKAALYFAPRPKEGIGMSFLEAMSRGRCVVAPNDSTMNEYIRHGENGLLYNASHPSPLDFSNIREMQKNCLHDIQLGYAQWKEQKYLILDWLREPPTPNPTRLALLKTPNKAVRCRLFGIPLIELRYNNTSWTLGFFSTRFPLLRLYGSSQKTIMELFGLPIIKITRDK